MFSDRESLHPVAAREFWHEIVEKGQSEEMQGPLEAALQLSEINHEDRFVYLDDMIRLMETDLYLATVTLLTAIANYGQSVRPYLNRLEVIRERMVAIYTKPYEESYIVRINVIIYNLE